MSSSDSAQILDSKPRQRKGRWTFWRVLRWGLASLLVLMIIAADYLWQNRYVFLEDTAERILAEQGLDAELSITHIQKQTAMLSDITISANGQSVFSADTLKVEYDWREALKGRMNRIELSGAVLDITVDEEGKIIDGWMPASNPDSELVLPPEGLHLINTRVRAKSPYGEVNATGNLTFQSFEDLKADFVIDPSVFSFGSLEVKGGGEISANIRPGENKVKAALDFTDMVHPLANLSYASVTADVILDLVEDQSHVSGPVKLSFAELKSSTVEAENGELNWDGSFSVLPNSAVIREADGKWNANVGRMTYSDEAGRTQLAKALTLNEAMIAAPVTTHFAESLTASVKRLLIEADVAGEGQFFRYDDKAEVKLTAPLKIKAKSTQVSISPYEDALFYDYNRETESIKLAANVALSGARSVSLQSMQLEARSGNGLSISGVSSFDTRAVLSDPWQASSPDGEVRLAPLTAQTRYVNTPQKREIRVELSPINYDGPLPGGYAAGLKTQGALTLDLAGEGLNTKFVPSGGKSVTLDRFETAAGWTAQDIKLDLVSEAPFYVRGADPETAKLTARVETVSTLLTEIETGRQLDIRLGAVDVDTDINGQVQNWTLGLFDAEIKTDDFGGVGTVIGAQEAVLLATLSPEADTQLELTSDAARVKTDQIFTQNMKVGLIGTPTDFHLSFGEKDRLGKGIVEFSDQALPQLPLRGHLDYTDGLIVGEAITVLPKAEDADISIMFRLKDGEGTAEIDIEQLTFTEKGFQPQNLIPALQGKIANVAGSVSATIDIVFSPDKPLQSFGRAKLNNIDFGTLPGPFSGVNTEIEFTSVFPLVSSGVQRLTMDSFNPGVNLVDGVIEYELVEDGVNFISAKWPLANGFITIDPTIWTFNAPENRVVLRIEDVSVGAFLGDSGSGGLTVSGDVVGEIPVVVSGVDVSIDSGRLSVENGGLIQYRTQELTSVVDLIPEKYVTLQDFQQFQEFRKNEDLGENVGKDLAFTALRNFEYKLLSVKLDGPLDGEIEVDARFIGSNPKILAGTEFDFNVNIVGELVNLVRSLKPDISIERIEDYLSNQTARDDAVETP